MNILIVFSHEMRPDTGGVQRVTQILSKGFLKKGFSLYYLSLYAGKENQVYNGVSQYVLPNQSDLHAFENGEYFQGTLTRNKIDIIINQNGFSKKGILFLNRNNIVKAKIVSVHHNCVRCLNDQYHNIYSEALKSKHLDLFLDNRFGWFLLKRIHRVRFRSEIKRTISLSDKIVLLSDKFISELDFYLTHYDRSKITSIFNPSPFKSQKLDLNEKENRILYVGTVKKKQKRVDRLISIWKEIYQRYPNWEMDILGEGNEKKDLEKLVRFEKLERVNFLGYGDPRSYLKRSKILLLTSDFEGFGMVLIEAQAYGVVPVCFDSFSSVYDVIKDKETGVIVKNFDLTNYIGEVEDLMSNQDKLNEMANNGRNHAKLFDSEVIVNQWIKLFENLKKSG